MRYFGKREQPQCAARELTSHDIGNIKRNEGE